MRAVIPLASRCFATATNVMKTSLYDFHVKNGGKMVEFAGYWLPVEYTKNDGAVLASHFWTRNSASLFDVSHMGQVHFFGKDRVKFFESITVADVQALKMNQARLSSIPNEKGGLIDDCIVTKRDNHLFLVINGACKHKDLKYIQAKAADFRAKGGDVTVKEWKTQSLVALQGPKAHIALQRLLPSSVNLASIPFLFCTDAEVAGIPCQVSRCGYTGEDGFEISVPHERAEALAEAIQEQPEVHPCGLGARDSLRLEAGMCLYGHELDETISPIEADLLWTITKRRRKEGGFPGFDRISREIKNGVKKTRVGLFVQGPPAREHTAIVDAKGKKIGEVSSGTFSPCLKRSISIAYVPPALSKIGTKLQVSVRGRNVPAVVTKMPFVPTRYFKPAAPAAKKGAKIYNFC